MLDFVCIFVSISYNSSVNAVQYDDPEIGRFIHADTVTGGGVVVQ